MDRPAITGSGRIRRCTGAKLEADPMRPIDEHLDVLLAPPSAQSIGEFFVDVKIWKTSDNV
jgi:hypothetical protein